MAQHSKASIEDRWVSEREEWRSIEEYLLFLKQKAAYQFAREHCKAKCVLDYGCGSGYGCRFLSDYAGEVVGVDISEEVIDYCCDVYRAPNLSFQKIFPNCALPFEDSFFHAIVSFQVIEHIPDVQTYLFELNRVLKGDGTLFITTPNRKHRLLPFQKPWNPEHVKEYSLKDLNRELSSVFKQVEILGVYGTEEINAIEYKRVKQKPFPVYVYNPATRVLKATLPSFIISVVRERKQEAPSQPFDRDLLSKYTLDDFTVGDELNKCLDFLVICHK